MEIKIPQLFFFGNFRTDMTLNEIEGFRQRFISDIKDKTLEWRKLSEEYDLNEEKTDNNQRRISEFNIKKYDAGQKFNKTEAELEEYDKRYGAVTEVLLSLSMNEMQAFTKAPENELEVKIAELEDTLKACERKIESMNEQRLNAEKGNVHIPQSAVDFLDNVGIDYQTGTTYLAEHKELCGNTCVYDCGFFGYY